MTLELPRIGGLRVAFFMGNKKHAPNRKEKPGACSDSYMMTYCLRHWLPRYATTHGLNIVLRYKQTKATPKDGPCTNKYAPASVQGALSGTR